MIYVVNRNSMEIVNRCDAWEQGGERRMRREAKKAGWVVTDVEITLSGDMVIWVE